MEKSKLNVVISDEQLDAYQEDLVKQLKAKSTIDKYMCNMRKVSAWLNGRPLDENTLAELNEHELSSGQAASTINGMFSAINSFCRFICGDSLHLKYATVQHSAYRDPELELTKDEFKKLVKWAKKEKYWLLVMVLNVLGGTGIRVSELPYITVEAVLAGQAVVRLKGKIRTIMIQPKLRKMLLNYIEKNHITSGEIFLKDDKRYDRYMIWRDMKALSERAGVESKKVFPHNIRHLFAVEFYRVHKDIVHLADVMGHSRLDTTRLYLATSGKEHARILERMDLIT